MKQSNDPLAIILRRIVDACRDLNEFVYGPAGCPPDNDKSKRASVGRKELVDSSTRKNVRYGGLVEIRRAVEIIAPPIDADDQQQRLESRIKSKGAGDQITEDKIYRVIVAAVGWFDLINSGRLEGSRLLEHESFQAHINEIRQLQGLPRGNWTEWGRVITEVIWYRRAEENFHVQRADLEPGGEIYGLIITDAEAACQKRRRGRIATFQRKCGKNCAAFLALDDSSRLKALETHSKTPEERDKAAARAVRLVTDAREIEAISVSDGELKEALRDRLVERIERMFR